MSAIAIAVFEVQRERMVGDALEDEPVDDEDNISEALSPMM